MTGGQIHILHPEIDPDIASSTHVNIGFNEGDADDEQSYETNDATSTSVSGEKTDEDFTCDETIDKSIPFHSTRGGTIRMVPISPISTELPETIFSSQ